MSDTSLNPVLVFACDSHGNNFDKYPQCENLNAQYIICRGSDIHQLKLETLQFLHPLSVLPDTPVIIKIAAGINDILNSISKTQALNADSILLKLEKYRSHIYYLIFHGPWSVLLLFQRSLFAALSCEFPFTKSSVYCQ